MLAAAVSGLTRAVLHIYGFPRKRVPVGGWRVVVYRGGAEQGPPWILLPGLGATGLTFLPLLRKIRHEKAIWIVETSAHGGTLGPAPAWDIPTGCELLGELLNRGDLPRGATLCGISLGGWVALRFALFGEQQLHRLLLLCPGGYRDQDWEEVARMVDPDSPSLGGDLWQALFVRPPRWILGGPLWLRMLYRSRVVRSTLSKIRLEDTYGAEELGQLKLPVGLIWGSEDRLFRVRAGREMACTLRTSRLWEIEGAAHALLWEKPAAVLQAVREFEEVFAIRPSSPS